MAISGPFSGSPVTQLLREGRKAGVEGEAGRGWPYGAVVRASTSCFQLPCPQTSPGSRPIRWYVLNLLGCRRLALPTENKPFDELHNGFPSASL